MVKAAQTRSTSTLALGALGVVFGDIGTSPLYSLRSVLQDGGGTARQTVLGLTSAVVWSLLLVVTGLYVGILMRHDNEGEGGLLALLALLRRGGARGRVRTLAAVVAMIGAATFLGDSVVTPAISVLSAAEGLTQVRPAWQAWVVPTAVVILVCIFMLQRLGSGSIGRFYGPVMVVWFLTLAAGGVRGLTSDPSALAALSPWYAVQLCIHQPMDFFVALGSVVLAVTGAEALYADLGHFGRRPITVAWLVLVLPCLMLAYLGEAAEVLHRPDAIGEPFYSVVPGWGRIPVLVLATLATIIASEAVIAGAFTVVHQAGGLGLCPVMRVRHTSRCEPGQIYLPAVNWPMAAAVLVVVVGFGSSQRLAAAYGIAVSTTIVMTITLFVLLQRQRRAHRSAWLGIGAAVGMAMFAAATALKVATGGWLPLGIAAVLFLCMLTWWRGQRQLARDRRHHQADLTGLVGALEHGSVEQFVGTGVFITQHPEKVPLALAELRQLTGLVPQHTIVLSWHLHDKPTSPPHGQCHVHTKGHGVISIDAQLGYHDSLDLPRLLKGPAERGGPLQDLDLGQAHFYVSRVHPRASRDGHMPAWQQHLFGLMHRLAMDDVDRWHLPRSRTIIISREADL